jgi:hypothetical protein
MRPRLCRKRVGVKWLSAMWLSAMLRVSILIRAMLTERWDSGAWQQIKAELKNALAEKARVRRAGWFN